MAKISIFCCSLVFVHATIIASHGYRPVNQNLLEEASHHDGLSRAPALNNFEASNHQISLQFSKIGHTTEQHITCKPSVIQGFSGDSDDQTGDNPTADSLAHRNESLARAGLIGSGTFMLAMLVILLYYLLGSHYKVGSSL